MIELSYIWLKTWRGWDMKKIFIGTLAILSLISLVACSSSKDVSKKSITDKGRIIVATESEFAPFEFKTLINGKDTLVGADVKLAKAIADSLGVDVTFSVMSFNNVLASVTSGKADIAIAGISVTEERKKAYNFSNSYYESENVVIIKKTDVTSYTSLNNLTNKSIGVQKGSIQENLASTQLPNSNIVSLTSNSEMINELKSNHLQAVVLEKAIAEGYVARNDDLMIADMTLKSKGTDAYAVAFAKGTNQDLIDSVNKVIADSTSSGKFDTWLKEAGAYTQATSSSK